MKFWTGFALGAAGGAFIATAMTEQQRTRTRNAVRSLAARSRAVSVVSTASDGVGDIADAAVSRVNGAIDHVATAAAERIATDDTVTEDSPEATIEATATRPAS